jgi:hypothetical protein
MLKVAAVLQDLVGVDPWEEVGAVEEEEDVDQSQWSLESQI